MVFGFFLVSPHDVLALFSRELDANDNPDIMFHLADGFGLLIAHDRIADMDIVAKLVVIYFNDATDPKITQILSIFFETLVRCGKQRYLVGSLSKAIALIDDDAETLTKDTLRSVVKFFIQSTVTKRTESASTVANHQHHHNAIAISLLTWMTDRTDDNRRLTIVSEELLTLGLFVDDEQSMGLLLDLVDRLLANRLNSKVEKNLQSFRAQVQPEKIVLAPFPSEDVGKDDENDEIRIENCECDDSVDRAYPKDV